MVVWVVGNAKLIIMSPKHGGLIAHLNNQQQRGEATPFSTVYGSIMDACKWKQRNKGSSAKIPKHVDCSVPLLFTHLSIHPPTHCSILDILNQRGQANSRYTYTVKSSCISKYMTSMVKAIIATAKQACFNSRNISILSLKVFISITTSKQGYTSSRHL